MTNKTKNILGAVFGVVFFVTASFLVQKYDLIQKLVQQSFDQELKNTAIELNKTCPMMVDDDTRLDNAEALDPNIFQYNYTLVNYEAIELNPDTLRKYLEPDIVNAVRTNPDLKVFRDHLTTLAYNYSDKNGVFLVKISVTPELYTEK